MLGPDEWQATPCFCGLSVLFQSWTATQLTFTVEILQKNRFSRTLLPTFLCQCLQCLQVKTRAKTLSLKHWHRGGCTIELRTSSVVQGNVMQYVSKKKGLPTFVWQLFCEWWVIECHPVQGHSGGPVKLAWHDSFLHSSGETASVSSSYCCKPETSNQEVHCTKYWSLIIDLLLKRKLVSLSLSCFLSPSLSFFFSLLRHLHK